MTHPVYVVLLFGLGVIAGFQNVMAGGGSLLTLPMMIFMMEPTYGPAASRMANGTNRIAILIQNIFAVGGFYKRGLSGFALSIRLSVFTLPGAILGARFATQIDNVAFKRVLGLVMVGVLIMMMQKNKLTKLAPAKARTVLGYVAMFGLGFYGGFIQAGAGFLLIAALHGLMNMDLVRTNMHKVFITLVYTVPALVVFALDGNVVWWIGLVLAAGNALGAWLGVHFAVKKGEKLIRVVLFIALLGMAVKLIFFTGN